MFRRTCIYTLYLSLKTRALTIRFLLIGSYIIVLAYFFWTSSRYPALNEKAIMEGATSTLGIGFDEKFIIDANMVWYEEVWFNTLNWIYTNKQGMTFGVLFATGLLMLFSLIKNRTFKNRFLQAGFGMLLGAPLGVCVNCAAPIAQGMRKGGASVETSLATMVSSPTLNLVVLSMLFSLFPWYMVAVKLSLTIVFILLLIPLIGKYVGKGVLLKHADLPLIDSKASSPVFPFSDDSTPKDGESLAGSVRWFVIKWIKSFWYILKMTVPLMLLAGVLGNVVITFLPWEALVAWLPAPENAGLIRVGLMLLVLGVIGLFLPVPMAFDIIICAVLIAAGVPEFYVMVLLFTLGIFSIYSFFIVRQVMSFKIALTSAVLLIGMGSFGGLVTSVLTPWNATREQRALIEVIKSDIKGPEVFYSGKDAMPKTYASIAKGISPRPNVPAGFEHSDSLYQIGVSSGLFEKDSGTSLDRFTRVSGDQLGISIRKEHPTDFMIVGKLSSSHSIASGDLHNDGWQDLAIVATGSLSVFANVGGKFEKQLIAVPDSLEVVTIAMVDVNDDDWLDLMFTTEGTGNYYLLNDHGSFEDGKLEPLPNTEDAWLTRPMAYADFDRDGDLDVLFGNYTSANYNQIRNGRFEFPERSRNGFLINEGGRYKLAKLPTSIAGETLTLLWSDLDNDGWVDLIETNDFAPPDVFYMNKEGVYDQAVKNSDKKFETSTKTTMSVVAADLDNDLLPEIYIGEIALMGLENDELLKVDEDAFAVCEVLSDPNDQKICLNYLELLTTDRAMKWQRKAQEIPNRSNMEFLVFLNNMRRDNLTCDEIPKEWSFLKGHCERVFNSEYNVPEKADIEEAIPSPGLGENVLLVNDGTGSFKNKANEWGIATGGYTWNAKFADLNADEYLDLFVVNGSHVHRTRQSNFLYLNEGGKHFTNRIDDYEDLNSFLATQTYTYMDIDNDGDQDIITLPVVGPAQVHINEMKKGNMIAFELRDGVGNSRGIGSKITIHYGKGGEKHQVRELLGSGGYLSSDPYIAYFGLGRHLEVAYVTIQWSTGEETRLTGPFEQGAKYEVRRSGKSLD